MLILGLIIIAGYLTFGRPFSYLGVLPIYPAEFYLLLAVLLSPGRWLSTFTAQFLTLRPATAWFVLFLLWGVFAVVRGLDTGYDAEVALKGFSAHYYILFYFIGESLGPRLNRQGFAKLFLVIGLTAGINGILFAAYTSRLDLYLPWAPQVEMFDVPAIISYVIVGLLAFSRHSGGRGMMVVALDLLAALANPGRAMWLSIMAGGGLVVAMQRSRRMVLQIAGGLLAVGILVSSVGSLIPTAEGRGGTLSPSWIVAQFLSGFDPETAHELLIESGERADALDIYARYGTIDWRYAVWLGIIDSLEGPGMWLLGHGYGFDLSDIDEHLVDLRSPHNFLIFLLGYTGLVGVAIYSAFSFVLARSFYRLPASPYRTFLLGQFVAVWTVALFGNALETPFVAVPFYFGMGLAYGAARFEAASMARRA